MSQSTGSSLYRQRKLIDQWLSDNPQVKESSLSPIDKGKSGYSGEHLKHGFGLILLAIEEGKIKPNDYILVEAIDRIGRLPPMEMISLIQKIVEKEVTIVTLEDGYKYTKQSLNNDMSQLFILVGKVLQAHEYSKRLSSRIKAAYEKKRRQARKGESIKITTPFWLKSSGELHPRKSEIVLKCIEMYLDGTGSRKIILELSKEYHEMKSVHPSTLKRWFSNRALIGEWYNKGDIIRDVFEPLITVNVFNKLKAQIDTKYKKMSSAVSYILSGLVICEKCGKPYHIRRKVDKDKTIVYMNCSTYLKRGAAYCENNKTVPYEVFLHLFNKTYIDAIHAYVSGLNLGEVDSKVEDLKSRISDIEGNIETLIDSFLEINSQSVKDRIASLEDEKLKIEHQLQSLTHSPLKKSEDILMEFEEGELSISFDHERSNEFERIVDSETLTNHALKEMGYRIVAKGNKAFYKGEFTAEGCNEITLLKRSQRHSCYIIEYNTPAYTTFDLIDEEITYEWQEKKLFAAVNRDRLIFEDNSKNLAEFIKKLNQVNNISK